MLTATGLTQSRWRLLDSMRSVPISYHSPASIRDGYFQAAAKGQEFVIAGSPAVRDWARALIFNDHIRKEFGLVVEPDVRSQSRRPQQIPRREGVWV